MRVRDAQRRVLCHRIERGKLNTSGVTVVGGEARPSAFAPHLPLQRAVALVAADARGRDALLVSGGHWDGSLCVSLAQGSGGTLHRLRAHADVVTCAANSIGHT